MVTLPRAGSALLLLAFGALLLSGCKKDEEAPQAVPIPSAASAPAAVKEDPKPAQTAGGSAAGTVGSGTPDAVPPPPPPAETAPAKPAPQASIDGCCAALSGIGKSGLPAATKAKAAAAAAVCAGSAKLVKEGKVSRSSALAQIGASMGGQAPAECK